MSQHVHLYGNYFIYVKLFFRMPIAQLYKHFIINKAYLQLKEKSIQDILCAVKKSKN